jgi:hypothetical protein
MFYHKKYLFYSLELEDDRWHLGEKIMFYLKKDLFCSLELEDVNFRHVGEKIMFYHKKDLFCSLELEDDMWHVGEKLCFTTRRTCSVP